MARNRTRSERAESRYASHQDRFIATLRGSNEMPDQPGSKPMQSLKFDKDLKFSQSIPHYRFEGVELANDWAISDSSPAWPLIDEIRESASRLRDLAYDQPTRFNRNEMKRLNRRILGLVDEIDYLNRRDSLMEAV